MRKPRIMVVCGFGLGSSMILKLKLDEVLKDLDIKAYTFCADATTAVGENYDIVFTSQDLVDKFEKTGRPYVVITNFLSKDEIKEKAIPALEPLLSEE
jgi:PTS system ascorbate-specific IIB component